MESQTVSEKKAAKHITCFRKVGLIALSIMHKNKKLGKASARGRVKNRQLWEALDEGSKSSLDIRSNELVIITSTQGFIIVEECFKLEEEIWRG